MTLKIKEIVIKNKFKKFVLLECCRCQKTFEREKKRFDYEVKKTNIKNVFCGGNCRNVYKKNSVIANCGNCNKETKRYSNEFLKSKSGNCFCSRSCSATYNNTHKTKGTRISKLENFLQKKLKRTYPNYNFHFNKKNEIESELDIYIAELSLAFEINGIFHYSAIFGEKKFLQIQKNDLKKQKECLEKGIELHIINSSSMIRFTEKDAVKYLNSIINIINGRAGRT